MTTGTLDYHLGDVTDGFVIGPGDNQVTTADISLLGAHYGDSGAALAGFEILDPQAETASILDQMRAGLMTYRDACAKAAITAATKTCT